MKRIVSIGLALTLLAGSIAASGCGEKDGTSPVTETTAAETTAPAETQAETEPPVDTDLQRAETVFDAFIKQYYDKGKFKNADFLGQCRDF